MSHDHHEHDSKWRHDGVRVIPGNTLDPNTAQTPGMDRKAAINFARVGAQKIWAGTVSIQPNPKQERIIMALLRVSFTYSAARRACVGANTSNSPPRPIRVISSIFRHSCRTRKSTPAQTS